MNEAEQKQYVAEHMDSDLQFVLGDCGVSLTGQVAIARRYGSMRKFRAVGDTRADVRRACLTDFTIPQDTPDGRAEAAAVVSAWEVAQEFINKETEIRAESKALGQPRTLQVHERQAMVKAVELVYGPLQDAEAPSTDYLSVKAEETETNEPQAAPLDEISSKRDSATSEMQTGLDSTGHIRITRTKVKSKMPSTTEDYRRVMRVEMNAWLCMAARYRAKAWLHGLTADPFNRFTDYILGEKVLNIQVPSLYGEGSQKVKPEWAIVLNYEHKLRREACKLIIKEGITLAEALGRVIKDPELKETYFTTPVALRAAMLAGDGGHQQKFQRFNSKGGGKPSSSFNSTPSKGKGKSKSKGKEIRKELQGLQLAWRTPDNRELCFGYNTGNCNGQCNRVHQCRVKGCYGDHPAIKHKEVLYLFAGKRRRSDVGSHLEQLQADGKIRLELLEFDIERSEDHDLRSKGLWEQICQRLQEGSWFLIVSPVVSNAAGSSTTPTMASSGPKAVDKSTMVKSNDVVDVDSSSESNHGEAKQVDSFGNFDMEACLNRGQPVSVEWDGHIREFVDGFGLCSPTRWPPNARGARRTDVMKTLAWQTFQFLVETVRECIPDVRAAAFQLVTGKVGESPFNAEALGRLRAKWAGLLPDPEDAAKFREEEALGRMFPTRLSVLVQEFGEDRVRVASMAAIVKPDGSVRPLHDGTHSVQVNNQIVYRDQIQCPGPAEVAAVVRESLESREAPFCVSADIKAAHRLVKVRRKDWPFLCCKADSNSTTVWTNCVGTFGISSAPYWWAKLFSLVGRFVGHLMGTVWFMHLVYVDDLHGVFTGGSKFLHLWVWILAFELVGTPFAYHKFRGGYASEFVGYQMRYDRNEVGISLRRGEWLTGWIKRAAEKRFVVVTREFAEFLGRLGFVSQVLVWLKPHLSPLYAWSSATAASTVAKLPDVVILTLKYLLAEFETESFMISAKRPETFTGEQFRTDAKCTDDQVVLGGWEISTGRWFQVTISPAQAPYLFVPGKGSQWASTSSELLASLAALKAFGWVSETRTRKSLEVVFSAGTDNRSNEFLSQKRATTKWPLMLINMQFSSLLARARIGVRLKWRPREENTVADDITNSIFTQLDPTKKVQITYEDLPTSIIHALWDTKADFDRSRDAAKQAAEGRTEKKRKRHDKTPW
eukprot:s4728_g1.t1